MQSYLKFALLAGAIGVTAVARADVTVPVHQATAQGPGAEVGTVALADSKYGLVLTPDLKDLPPGVHGFHIHENGSCDAKQQDGKPVPAGAAGGHYDPDGRKKQGTTSSDDGPRGDLAAS